MTAVLRVLEVLGIAWGVVSFAGLVVILRAVSRDCAECREEELRASMARHPSGLIAPDGAGGCDCEGCSFALWTVEMRQRG